MKKYTVFAVAILVFAILSVSVIFLCTSESVSYTVPENFLASLKLKSEYGTVSGELTKTGSLVKIAITSPEKLQGLEFRLTNDDYKIVYKGVNISSDSIPEKLGFIPDELFSLLDIISQKSSDIELSGDAAYAEYDYKGLKIHCGFDRETATPLWVKIDGINKKDVLELSFFSRGDTDV